MGEQFFRHIAQPTAHDRNKNIARSSNLELEIEGVAACLSNQIWDRPSQATGRDPTPEAAQAAAETNWVAEAQRERRNPTQDATASLFYGMNAGSKVNLLCLVARRLSSVLRNHSHGVGFCPFAPGKTKKRAKLVL